MPDTGPAAPDAPLGHRARDEGVPVEMRPDAILWMINRVIFHPRGFALGVDQDTGALLLYGDGTEVWTYAESMNDAEEDAFVRFEAMLQRVRDAHA